MESSILAEEAHTGNFHTMYNWMIINDITKAIEEVNELAEIYDKDGHNDDDDAVVKEDADMS